MILHKIDEAWLRVEAEPSVFRELQDYLTFDVPGAKFSPKYKAKIWDGRIKLLDGRTGKCYAGLVQEVSTFCEERGYILEIDPELTMTEEFSLAEAKEFADTLNLPFVPHDHQLRAFALAVRNSRGILISPTASGLRQLELYLPHTVSVWVVH